MAMTMWAICFTRQSKDELTRASYAGNETFCRRNDQKTSTGIPQVEAQARVTPEVAPAFPQVEKTKPGSLY